MDGRFNNPFISEPEEPVFASHITDSPPRSSVINNDGKLSSVISPKKSKRSVQKRVVTVPISDVNGSRLKGEGAPPTDSWAWRKYGQKPIKGSPYPRGYYRCSSSKGCPARKQVERSRADPTMLVITYACEHNHAWPASKSTTKSANSTTTNATTNTTTEARLSPPTPPEEEPPLFATQPESDPDTQFAELGDDSMITTDDFTWFSDVESTYRTILETPFCSNDDSDMTMIFPMREEDESLFADLGELPECSLVFRREEEERRRCSLRTSWCESTG